MATYLRRLTKGGHYPVVDNKTNTRRLDYPAFFEVEASLTRVPDDVLDSEEKLRTWAAQYRADKTTEITIPGICFVTDEQLTAHGVKAIFEKDESDELYGNQHYKIVKDLTRDQAEDLVAEIEGQVLFSFEKIKRK